MKTVMIALACLCMTGTVGCTALGGGSAVSLKTADEKALIAVEESWRAVLIAVNAAVDSGQLRGESAASVRVKLAVGKRAVDAARGAYAAGQAVQMSASIAEATSALAGIRSILGQ